MMATELNTQTYNACAQSRVAHLNANQHVEDGNKGKRYQVTGEEDGAESEDSIKLRKRPLSMTSDVLKAPYGKTVFAVDQQPRYEQQCRCEPDQTN